MSRRSYLHLDDQALGSGNAYAARLVGGREYDINLAVPDVAALWPEVQTQSVNDVLGVIGAVCLHGLDPDRPEENPDRLFRRGIQRLAPQPVRYLDYSLTVDLARTGATDGVAQSPLQITPVDRLGTFTVDVHQFSIIPDGLMLEPLHRVVPAADGTALAPGQYRRPLNKRRERQPLSDAAMYADDVMRHADLYQAYRTYTHDQYDKGKPFSVTATYACAWSMQHIMRHAFNTQRREAYIPLLERDYMGVHLCRSENWLKQNRSKPVDIVSPLAGISSFVNGLTVARLADARPSEPPSETQLPPFSHKQMYEIGNAVDALGCGDFRHNLDQMVARRALVLPKLETPKP